MKTIYTLLTYIKYTIVSLVLLTVQNAFGQNPGQALELNVTNSPQYATMTMGNNILQAEYTVEAWIRPKANAIGQTIFAAQAPTGLYITGFGIGLGSNDISVSIPDFDGTNYSTIAQLDIPFNYSPGHWYHLACIVSAANKFIKFYINGAQVFSMAQTFNSTRLFDDKHTVGDIGYNPWAANSYYSGDIDELRIYNSSTINPATDAVSSSVNGANAYYQFDNSTATLGPSATNAVLVGPNGLPGYVQSYAMYLINANVATVLQPTGFTANWVANINSNITNYFVDVATDAAFNHIVLANQSFSPNSINSGVITGLSPSTQYYYRVSANNTAAAAAGQGAFSGTIAVSTPANLPTLYVDAANGNDSYAGTSWGAALGTLGYALQIANTNYSVKNILIAKGSYYPAGTAAATTSKSDTAFPILRNGIRLYGGYNASTGVRNTAASPTYLDGNNSSYHIVVISGIGAGDSVIFDGLTIRNANCNGNTSHTYNSNGFNGNEGGGVSAINNSGLANKLLFRNCAFTNNTGNNHAAAFYNNASSPVFVNCLFANNSDAGNGGTILNYNSSNPVFTNCTIAYNVCAGGSTIASVGGSTPVFNNSIMWLNGAAAGGNNSGITSDASPAATGSNNIIQGGLGANSTADPLFVNAASGNFNLSATSPAINAGSNTLYVGNTSTDVDLNGSQRFSGPVIDMGCYETQPNTVDKTGLTSVTAAAAAYSLRLLSSSYTGSAITVRRTTDNATRNIGFTSNGDLDTATLKTFVGTGTGYITAWYDQTGNGYTMAQANTTLQPYIVLNGVVQRLNNQPAIYFATSNLATAQATIFTVGASMAGVAKGNSATASGMVTKTGTSAGANLAYPGPFDFGNTLGVFTVGNASTQVFNGIGLNTATPVSVVSSQVPASVYSFVIPSSGSYSSYLNGVQTGTQIVSAFADNGNSLMLGNRASGGDAGNLWLPEIILFNSALPDASRQTIEASQISYYLLPAITSFSPVSARAGQAITVKGSFFKGATAISFGGTAATAFTVVSDSVIVATAGEGSSGNLSVTTPAGTATLSGFTAINTAPNSISYPSPAIFVKGVNTNGVTPAQEAAGTKTQVPANFNNPQGVAADIAGNLFVADLNAGTVYKVSATNGAVTTLASGFTSPQSIAVDAAGNVYVTDYETLKKITPGGTVTTIAQVSGLSAIAVDAAGNLYVTTWGGAVEKVQPGNGAVTVLWSNPAAAYKGITVDAIGNIYFTDWDTYNTGNSIFGTLRKIALDGTSTSIGNQKMYAYPGAVAVDRLGNIYVSENYNQGDIWQVTAAGVRNNFIYKDINGNQFLPNCSSIATDVNGNIYYIDGSVHGVIKIAGPGGVITSYSIQPALPAGLSLNATTGQVSGTAQAALAMQTYTITASNNGGSTATTLQLAVTDVAPGDFTYTSPTAPFALGRAITAYTPAFVAAGTSTNLHVFNQPTGEAADNNYVYVINDARTDVQKLSRIDGSVSTIATGFSNAVALAADGKGNIYVADRNHNSVSKITANNTVSVIASGLQTPNGLASDSAGNVYIAESGGSGPIKVIDTTGNITTVGTAVSGILCIAINPVTQEIYMGNGFNQIIKEPAGGGNTTVVSNAYPAIFTPSPAIVIAFDKVGNLNILLSDNSTTQLTSNGVILGNPFGSVWTAFFASDPSNNVYLTDNKYTNYLTKITGAGGAVLKYTISQSLPAGLTLNSSTGVISGTPTVVSATSTYLITASNNAGYNTTAINIGVQNPAATAMYVDSANGNDNNNGSSWAQAYKTLSYALHVAAASNIKDSILIAKGTYYPAGTAAATTANGDSALIILNNGIKLYGGYNAATGDRNAALNKTFLDGNNSSYHILAITGIGAGDSVVIDGVTIRNANCNGNTLHTYNGNGFNGNEGGGVSAINNNGLGNKLLFRNCTFTNNTGNNYASAVYNNASSPSFVNCLFTNNAAPNSGGAIFNYNSSNPVFTNCTIAYNVCSGGGVMASAGSSAPVLNNSIVWLNGTSAGSNNSGITSDATPVATSSYSIIQGGVGSNSTADPLFVNAATGNYQLSALSPAINTGFNGLYTGNINTDVDLTGNSRLAGTLIDMGAYESIPQNVYVDSAAGSDANNGSTWATAFKTLGYALQLANPSATAKNIFIAKGTYYPAGTAAATAGYSDSSFTILRNGIRLYGGYNATTGVRNAVINKTYLDGNNNSYHVLIISGVGTGDSVIVDGVNIRNAKARAGGTLHSYNGTGFNSNEGGAVAAKNNSGLGNKLLFRNCAFISNNSDNDGAGFYNAETSPVFVNCLFANNTAAVNGGAMFNYDGSNPVFSNCTIAYNVSAKGAAIDNYSNCTPVLNNSIVWLNGTASGNNNGGITSNATPVATGSNSIIQGGAGSNSTADPLFISAASGNFSITALSPAINAGSNALYAGHLNADADLNGNTRLTGATIDIGAYEAVILTKIYVDSATGSDSNDGSAWGKALKTLSGALKIAVISSASDTVYIAAGTYYPAGTAAATTANSDSAFAITRNGIRLYGGYNSATGVRNTAANKTYLDGNNSSYHVLVIAGIGAGDSVIVDGITVQRAYVNGGGAGHTYNGVAFNRDEGAGVAIRNNSALGNKLLFSNCAFINNNTSNNGAAVYNGVSSPAFVNCLFANNSGRSGTVFSYDHCKPLIVNCTFANNVVTTDGGALTNLNNSIPEIDNSIIWLNGTNAGANNSGITNDGSSGISGTNNIIQGGVAGSINSDPLFINAGGGNYTLASSSPALNTGSNGLYIGNINTSADLSGNTRLAFSTIDMGAYEYRGPYNLTYTGSPFTFVKGTAISLAPSLNGSAATGFTISPALPAGLSIGALTGVISGIPSAISAPASYTIAATNSSGNTIARISITINDVAPSGLSYAGSPFVFTKGAAITTITPSSGGGQVTSYSVNPAMPAGLSFNTTTGAISGIPTVLSGAADYTVTATNSGGSTTAIISITVNDVSPSGLSYTGSPYAFTKGSVITAITPATGGGVVISYSISPALPSGLTFNTATGAISGTPTVLSVAANYTITATNTGGSTSATISITVNDVAPAMLDYTPAAYTFKQGIAAATATPSVTGSNINYTITPALPAGLAINAQTGVIGGMPTVLSASANYTVTATNSGGTVSVTLSIGVVVSCPGPTSSTSLVSVCATSLPYHWNGTDYNTGGTYTFSTTNADGCDSVATLVLKVVPNNVAVKLSAPAALKCYGTTVFALATVKNGMAPYQYSIDAGAGYQDIARFRVAPGTYTVTVKDAAGCMAASNTITVNAGPDTTIAVKIIQNLDCNTANGTLKLDAAGGFGRYTYSIDSINYQPSNIFNITVPNVYRVFVKDSAGCLVKKTITANHLSATLKAPHTALCNSGTTFIQAKAAGGTAPYQYSFDGGTTYQDTLRLKAGAGNYAAIVKDAAGCMVTTNSVTLVDTAKFALQVAKTLDCSSAKGTITLHATGGYGNYAYSIDSINFQADSMFNVTVPNVYRVYVTDSAGCRIKASVATGHLSSTITVAGTALCNAGTKVIKVNAQNGSAPYQYSFNGGATYQGANSFAAPAGSYVAKVIDAAGCIATTNTLTLTQVATPLGVTVARTNVSCNGGNDGSITALANGGYAMYVYSINGSNYQGTGVFINLPAGVYKVTAKDSNACTISKNITITQPATPCGTLLSIPAASSSLGGMPDELKVKVYPNPAQVAFKLEITSGDSKQPVEVRVMDMLGKTIYHSRGSVFDMFNFGNEFASGVYIVEVLNGTGMKRMKLIKGE